MTTVSPSPLAAELVAEFGHVLPPALILHTVAAARDALPGEQDDDTTARTARTDVVALAEAVARRTSGESLSA